MRYMLGLINAIRKIAEKFYNKDDVTVRVAARRKLLIDDGCPEYRALSLAIETEDKIKLIDKDHPIWGEVLSDLKKSMGV